MDTSIAVAVSTVVRTVPAGNGRARVASGRMGA
jgi:hypothetical protein